MCVDFLKNACLRASKHNNILATEKNYVYMQGNVKPYASINLYSIYQILIADTGRFVEANAADLLITLPHIEEAIQNTESEHDIIYFGLRKFGVDHDAYIRIRLMEAARMGTLPNVLSDYYRKIYAVEVKKFYQDDNHDYRHTVVTLMNITNEITMTDVKNAAGIKF